VIRWIPSLVLVLAFACANVASASSRSELYSPSPERLGTGCDAENAEILSRAEIAYSAFLDHFQARTGLFTLNDPINNADPSGLLVQGLLFRAVVQSPVGQKVISTGVTVLVNGMIYAAGKGIYIPSGADAFESERFNGTSENQNGKETP
jgi:Mor family transcriptional regulator